MKISWKLLPWLLVVPAIPTGAGAVDITPTYSVYVDPGGGLALARVGAWKLDLEDNLETACRYAVRWVGSGGPLRPADLYLDELKTVGHASCEANSTVGFSTSIALAPELPAVWYNGASIRSMTLIEDGSGTMSGTVELATGGVLAVVVRR